MKKFVALLGFVVFVAVAWTVAWFWVAMEIRTRVTALAAADGETAPRLTCGDLAITGFPFRFDLECRQGTLVSGDITATVEAVRASVLVYNPTQMLASALGPVTLADAFTGARSRIDYSSLQLSARLVDWRPGRISLVADDVVWTDTLFGENRLASSTHLEAHVLDMPERHDAAGGTAALAGFASLEGLAAPAIDVADGRLEVELELAPLPDTALAYLEAGTIERLLAGQGVLTIVGVNGEAGDSFVHGDGRLAVNASRTLDGEINLTSRGIVDRIEALFPGSMNPLVVGNAAADGSYSQTLRLAGGIIFAGILPIGVVPPLP